MLATLVISDEESAMRFRDEVEPGKASGDEVPLKTVACERGPLVVA